MFLTFKHGHMQKRFYFLYLCLKEELTVFIFLTLPSDSYSPWIRNCTGDSMNGVTP